MKRENISEAIGNIDERYVQEAAIYTRSKKKGRLSGKYVGKATIAAVLALCFFAAGLYAFFPFTSVTVSAYAYGTGQELTDAGAVMDTGRISDDGEMKGHPLMFYLSGENIERVRFSCKNQQIDFRDWTEKRDEYGDAQNFTVSYGADNSEYSYLLVDWVPDATIQELTDHRDTTIKTLPENLREDIIVLEITFANGKKLVKAITISLLNDGTFFATFGDYSISDKDTFVNRTDSKAIPREILYTQGSHAKMPQQSDEKQGGAAASAPGNLDPAAEKAAREYYADTVFEVISMKEKFITKNKVEFSVRVAKDGVIQNPDRMIRLQLKKGTWKVVGEGY